MAESHKVLDNSFLSSQTHLTDHISDLNYQACLDIVTAMSTYTDFVSVSRELVEADEVLFREILKSWDELGLLSDELFLKLDKKAVDRILRVDEDNANEFADEDKDDNARFRYVYDELIIHEFLDDQTTS